ncbi:Protein DGCR6L [Trichinella pseudospiralis]|uniref:Protein DGCR6L n=2 Tax=Trichinella pseudospiralis TaxID=6337 RepID=A0A0V1ENA6_TRIPS|nr:Protein DGCR6L [Trichinella pseudospiralis]
MCKRAHSAVVYLCVESGTQRASQPGHIQRMNHPRLELMGPLMAARLVRILFSTLNLTVVLLNRAYVLSCGTWQRYHRGGTGQIGWQTQRASGPARSANPVIHLPCWMSGGVSMWSLSLRHPRKRSSDMDMECLRFDLRPMIFMNGERNAPECKRDTYFRQLKLLTANLKSSERRIIDDNVLFALAGSLVDDNVFQIVCELKDIQDLKEYDMFEKYSQFVNESNLAREALLTRQELDIRRCYSVAETLSTAERNRLELETLNKETELKRRRLVGELLHELDNLIISQQTILEKAGIPLFRRTDSYKDIGIQMAIIRLILQLF